MVSSAAPLFTIITSTLNSSATLERCIESVAAQKKADFEHLIVDGASTDTTLQIVETLASHYSLRLVCSQPDSGIYQAWNRGVAQASGKWILFLGSDDSLVHPLVLYEISHFISKFSLEQKLFVFGDTLADHNEPDWSTFTGLGRFDRLRGITNYPGTGSTLISSSLFTAGYQFDESYRICADHKFFAEHNFFHNSSYIPVTVTRFMPGGISSSKSSEFAQYFERRRMLKEIGRPRPFFSELYYWSRARLSSL